MILYLLKADDMQLWPVLTAIADCGTDERGGPVAFPGNSGKSFAKKFWIPFGVCRWIFDSFISNARFIRYRAGRSAPRLRIDDDVSHLHGGLWFPVWTPAGILLAFSAVSAVLVFGRDLCAVRRNRSGSLLLLPDRSHCRPCRMLCRQSL